MMSNIRATLWRIFGILFILSITFTAYAQQEQQPAALSQSQFEKILDKIDESEDEMRTLTKNLMNLTRNLMKNLVNLTRNLMNLTNRLLS